MRTSTMSLTIESVHAYHIANSRSGAVWGARGASHSWRIIEESFKPVPRGPISNHKAGNMLEMGCLTYEELNLMPAGPSGLSCGAVWDAGAAWTPGAAGDPPPSGAAWGCSMPEAALVNEGRRWIQ